MPWKECHVMDAGVQLPAISTVRRGAGRLAELDTPGREAPGRHPPHRLIVN